MESDCDKVIESLSLIKVLQEHRTKNKIRYFEKIKLSHPNWDEKRVTEEFNLVTKYDIVGCSFVESFFEAYKGLKERIEREADYARKNGHVISWKGVYRRLPELRYMKFGKSGGLSGADKKLWSGYYSNLINISSNTDAQTLEAFFAFTTWARTNYFCKLNKLNTRIYSGTHDSLDSWNFIEEEKLVISLAKKIASRKFTPDTGIVMGLDSESADLNFRNAENKKEEQYYKKGKEIKCGEFEIELKDFEEKFNRKLEVPEWLFV